MHIEKNYKYIYILTHFSYISLYIFLKCYFSHFFFLVSPFFVSVQHRLKLMFIFIWCYKGNFSAVSSFDSYSRRQDSRRGLISRDGEKIITWIISIYCMLVFISEPVLKFSLSLNAFFQVAEMYSAQKHNQQNNQDVDEDWRVKRMSSAESVCWNRYSYDFATSLKKVSGCQILFCCRWLAIGV